MRNRLTAVFVISVLTVLITISSGYGRTVMAWVSACDLDDARIELQKFYGIKEAITVIGLQWWLPDLNGDLLYSTDYDPNDPYVHKPEDATVKWFRDFADQNGIKVYLCLFNCEEKIWDWSIAQSAFVDPADRQNTINALVSEVERLDLDGVDLDLEAEGAVSSSDRSAYTLFVNDLSAALHNKGKKLSICTFASDAGSPGLSWISDWNDKVDHVMCMAYEWAGVSGSITYQSLANAGSSLPNGAMCLGVNADLNDYWQGSSAQENLQGIYNISSVGLCIWTCSIKGGGQWQETATWDIVKSISNKTITVDTTIPSPNLVPIFSFTGNADPASSCDVSVNNGVLNAKMTQGGSVDDGHWANTIGMCTNDFKDVTWIKIKYTSTKPFTLQLYQEDLDTAGECFRESLPAASSMTTRLFKIGTFFQPWWAKDFKELDLSKVHGLTLDPELEGMGNTTINVEEIICYGRSDWTTPIIENNGTVHSNSLYTLSLYADALSFTVPTDGYYAIGIYRANGRIVRRIINDMITKGSYTVNHVSKGLSKGIYYARLYGQPGEKVSPMVVW